jgi:hypothetical protein
VYTEKAELTIHPQFKFDLQIHLCWLNNCLDERDALEQIVFVSMDSDFCAIVSLSIYLQYAYKFTHTAQSKFLFWDIYETPELIKIQVVFCCQLGTLLLVKEVA